MEFHSYQETLSYLYSLLPMYQREGAVAFKKDLSNTIQLCEALGNPERRYRSILVAGTNGKGSVSSMLFSILRTAGFKVGLYTSPHLLDFTERIRINEQNISKSQVIDFVSANQKLIEEIRPSFFEFTVAMAFAHFAQHTLDWAVVEVGLGGRLDSTNVIQQDLGIITNISLDHQQYLGNTLPEIAYEKAGIMKAQSPMVIGESHSETDPVFRNKAKTLSIPLFFADQLWGSQIKSEQFEGIEVEILKSPGHLPHSMTYQLDLAGAYQQKNLLTVLEACRQLQSMEVPLHESHIKTGLNQTKSISGIRGRMEWLQAVPRVFADTAHNEAGVKALVQQVGQMDFRNLHLVWGMVDDKEHQNILSLLPKRASYYFVQPQIPRSLDSPILAKKAAQLGLFGQSYRTVKAGIEAALARANPEDLIWIGGSTFVVAEALPLWEL